MSKKRQAIKTKIHEFWNYIKVAFNIKSHLRNTKRLFRTGGYPSLEVPFLKGIKYPILEKVAFKQ